MINLILALVLLYFYMSPKPEQVFVWSVDIGAKEINQMPIVGDSLLTFSLNVNRIETSLNQAIEKFNLDLPRVKLFDSSVSYKSPDCILRDPKCSWLFIVNSDLLIIVLQHDVASVLTSSEIKAAVIHEICHAILGHLELDSLQAPYTRYKRNINKEIDADRCAVSFGISQQVVISAIEKLHLEEEEKTQRISALTQESKYAVPLTRQRSWRAFKLALNDMVMFQEKNRVAKKKCIIMV